MDRITGFGPVDGGSIPPAPVWHIGADSPAEKGTIIFLVADRRVKSNSVRLIVQDYLEDHSVSEIELDEIERINQHPSRIKNSFLVEKLKPYMLPFHLDLESRS